MAKRTRPKQLAAFLDNYRAATLLILAALFSVSTIGQTIPQVNNVPWYEFAKKLSAGKVMLKQSGTYDTSFTIPYITASVVLDTITEDKTVTFPNDSATTGRGVVILVWNVNNSEHTWNVSGNVLESHDGSDIDTLGRGGHLFYWTGAYWSRLAASGGGGGVILGSDFYIQNGPSSVNLKTLGYEVNDSTLGIKSIGIVAGTGVTIDTLVGEDSIRWTINATGGGSGSLYVGNSGNSGERLLWSSPGSPDTLYGKRLVAGSNVTLTNNGDSTITIASAGGNNAWVYGGNTVGADSSIGTLDNFSLLFKTNGVVRSRILGNGTMLFNKSSGTASGTLKHQFGDSVAIFKPLLIDETGVGTITGSAALMVRSKDALSTEGAINVANSSGTVLMRLTNAGALSGPYVSTWTSGAMRFPAGNYNIQAGITGTTTGNYIFFSGSTPITGMAGNAEIVASRANYSPTTGAGNVVAFKAQTTVNQTGSATGNHIGFENAPGLTALIGRNIAFKATTGETELKSLITNLEHKTAAYTADAEDYTITCDATSAAFTVTLPAASGITGRIYVIKKTDASANAVTVDANASETIDGATTYSLAAQWKYVTIQSNGTNWVIIGNN